MRAAQRLVVVLDKAEAAIEAAVLGRRFPGPVAFQEVSGGTASGSGTSVGVTGLGITHQSQVAAQPLLPLADAVMVWHTVKVDAGVVACMPRARALVRVGVGFDNVDLEACGAAGLPVANVPNYGTEEVADHTMSLILAMFRRTVWAAGLAERGVPSHGAEGVAALAGGTRRMRGAVLGLLGCGRIGTAVALRAKAFGLSVAFYDPKVPAGTDKALGIVRVPSPGALASVADCLSVHCDLNPTSWHVVDGPLLRRMRRGSFVVNTARGGVVDEVALRAALEDGHLAGAGIDVHEVEPYLGPDVGRQPLAGAPNCVCTPHTAFFSEESYVEMRTLAAEAAGDALDARLPDNIVNGPWLDKAKWAARCAL